MRAQRYLCSQLVALRNNSVESIVNLEEIWTYGGVFESEGLVTPGAYVEIRCGTAFFAGKIVHVEPHELGWRFEVAFSPLTHWNPAEFQPLHLLDVSKVNPG